jgi:hypothetical protein
MGDINVAVRVLMMIHTNGLINYKFIPQGRTVNKEMYIEILYHLRDAAEANIQKNGHEMADFFCTTTQLHSGHRMSKCTLSNSM